MQRMIDEGNVFLGKYHEKRDDWTINYRVPKKTTRKLKTVWWEKAYDAGTHGTEMLKNFSVRKGCSRSRSPSTPFGTVSPRLSESTRTPSSSTSSLARERRSMRPVF